jgi:hypothetical protein
MNVEHGRQNGGDDRFAQVLDPVQHGLAGSE